MAENENFYRLYRDVVSGRRRVDDDYLKIVARIISDSAAEHGKPGVMYSESRHDNSIVVHYLVAGKIKPEDPEEIIQRQRIKVAYGLQDESQVDRLLELLKEEQTTGS